MRANFIILIVSLFVSLASAELPKTATLDEILAVATRPEQPAKGNGYDVERYNALERLRTWPKASPEDEKRIAAAFYASLRATNALIQETGASGLGHLGYAKAIPTIMELGEKDQELIRLFFQSYGHKDQTAQVIDALRHGLHSQNPYVRHAVLVAIERCNAVALRTNVETIIFSDPVAWVRKDATSTLMSLGPLESLPAFRQAFASGLRSESVVYALARYGNDDDILAVLPLLKSKDENLRRSVAQGLSKVQLVNLQPACDALLEALHDSSNEVRIAAMQALGHFHDSRAIAPIHELILHPPRPISYDDRHYYVEAVSAIGGPKAIALLNDMVQEGFATFFGLEPALARFGSPSSARAVWAAYLKDPIRKNTSFSKPLKYGCFLNRALFHG